MDIKALAKEGYSVVTGSAPFSDSVQSYIIMHDTDSYAKLVENVEISRFCEKRLRGINTSRGGYSPRDLMFACICTDGYKVSEECLDSVSNDDVMLIWSHIDTLKISSTLNCRTMISELVGARSCKGFRRYVGMVASSAVNLTNHLSVPRSPPTERVPMRDMECASMSSMVEAPMGSILAHLDYASAGVSPPHMYYTKDGMLVSDTSPVHNDDYTACGHATLEDAMAEEVMRHLKLR